MNKIDLNNRCAIVTGGAQGFGRAIAERFVASGAKVAIWDHDLPLAEKTAKAIGSGVTAIQVDVSDLAAGEKARDATLQAFGKIDILVNNAGIAGINKTVWETDLDEWRKVLRINLTGVFLCCNAVVPAMLQKKYGRIVNIASIAGKEGNPNAAHYSAAKAGVIALTKSLGKELATSGILVNCITPAVIQTDILKQVTQQHIDYMLSKIPMGRFGKKEEAAAMVAWLCWKIAPSAQALCLISQVAALLISCRFGVPASTGPVHECAAPVRIHSRFTFSQARSRFWRSANWPS